MIEFNWTPEFDFLSAEYRGLFSRSDATAFQHPLWLDSVYARLVHPLGAKPAILTGHTRKDGRLVFVLPMVRRRYGPLAVAEYADMGVTDYCSPVIDRELAAIMADNPAMRRQLLKRLGSFAVSRLQKIRAEAVAKLGVLGPSCRTFMGFHAHEAHLSAPFSEWRTKALSDSFRRFLDRKRRRLQKKTSPHFAEVSGPEAIREAFLALRAFHGQRWERNLLSNDAYFDFYVDVACRGQELGLARTYLYSAGTKPAGVLFGISYRRRFMVLLMGIDYSEFRNYSLGLLMSESAIEDSIARGDEVFDLTIGDEAFKSEFGTASTPMMTLWAGAKPLSAIVQLAHQWRAKGCSRKADGGDVQYALR